ncbi:hypothetical protein SLEP1_g23945 [Rubroshorea leprosula]|uniref:Transcription factor UNE10 n=1 Tax=Rubroshorea leprosula TaxID=152421 RepID=A0AAV5JK04_9ROSI|nr:hypothetical protein SLEP1_g23945 [Rubroshorea leprosula]
MSQCVPSWDLDDNPAPAAARYSIRSNSNSTAPDVTMVDYEVAELTWENGQIAMHGLGPPRVVVMKPMTSTSISKCTWDKQPRASGTLESIVNQATRLLTPCCKGATTSDCVVNNDEHVPWFNHHRTTSASASTATVTMDALVPCSNWSEGRTTKVTKSVPALVGCSTHVASCSGPVAATHEEVFLRHAREAPVPVAGEWSSRDQSASASATFGSQQMTLDTYEKDLGRGFTSTSLSSPENTSSEKPGTKTTTGDDHDSSEDNELLPPHKSSLHYSTDKASMLDEVIEYLKQLQAQVHVMSRMNIPAMVLPISMQQQLQMSMMAPMGIGMGMGMGLGFMDINTLSRPNMAGISPIMPANPFMPMTSSWDSSATGRLQPSPASVVPDPLSPFLACQSQPMTLDAYSRMAAIYQQMQQQQQQQPPASNSKS